MKLTGAAILVSRGMKVLQAAPAAYPYRSAALPWTPSIVFSLSVIASLDVLTAAVWRSCWSSVVALAESLGFVGDVKLSNQFRFRQAIGSRSQTLTRRSTHRRGWNFRPRTTSMQLAFDRLCCRRYR